MPVGMGMRWTGNKKFVRQAATRSRNLSRAKAQIRKWKYWVIQKRILRMYQQGGYVRGEQGRWPANSSWTTAGKGHGRPMLSGRNYQFGTMSRRYIISDKRRGARISFLLQNKARSADGFDYPSALHKGYRHASPITPKEEGGVLMFAGPGGLYFARSTWPQKGRKIPARPHLKFFEIDWRVLAKTLARWTLWGERRLAKS